MNSASLKWSLFFFVALLGISFAYNYPNILFERPYSIHQWRQCDCLSLTLNYYKEGMHFFRPITNWSNANGTGKVCPSECPIIYYGVACLWKIFGYHEFIYRLVIIAISFAGLFFLYKLSNEILHDHIIAIMVALFLFASPIYAYYSNNFLIEVPSLSFAIIGWYFFIKYSKLSINRFFYISIFFFLLAALTKLSSLVSFSPILLLSALHLIGKRTHHGGLRIFGPSLKILLPIIMAISAILLWLSYVLWYNSKLDLLAFSTQIIPIWQADLARCKEIFHSFYHNLLPQFYSPFMLVLLICMFLVILFRSKRTDIFFIATMCIAISVVVYFILWYDVLDVHDYYLINLLIIVPCILISFLHYLKKHYTGFFASNTLKVILFLILSYNIYYTTAETRCKYPQENISKIEPDLIINQTTADFWNWFHWNYNQTLRAYETIEPYNRSLGIKREDKVVSIPDPSLNITLYLMDQKGFTDYFYPVFDDVSKLKFYILLDAKYLFINDSNLLKQDWLQPYIKHPIGKYSNIRIYNLQPPDIMDEVLKTTKEYITRNTSLMRNIKIMASSKHLNLDSVLTADAKWAILHDK